MTMLQNEPADSSSATGRGPCRKRDNLLMRNNVSMDGSGSCTIHLGVNDSSKGPSLLRKINQSSSHHPVAMENSPGDLAAIDDFQGESQPMHEQGIICLIILLQCPVDFPICDPSVYDVQASF